MSLRQETPCDYGPCPYGAVYDDSCEYWCGADEPADTPEFWDENINDDEEEIMPNEISTGRKTIGNFTIEYQRNGYGGCIPVIDGQPQSALMFGYVTESDRSACMKLIEDALRATGNDVAAIQHYIMTAVRTAANDIHPDEAVDVNGNEILISYAAKTAYLGMEEIANLADLTCELPNEAIKALLVSRTETALAERAARHEIDDYAWEDDDYDEEFDYI